MCGDTLGHSKLEDLRAFLKERKADYIENIHVRFSDGTVMASIPVAALGSHSGQGKTSRRQLTYLRKSILKELNLKIEFLICRGEEEELVEEGLTKILKKKFPDYISETFMSFIEYNMVDVWIDLSCPVPQRPSIVLNNIESETNKFCNFFNYKIVKINWSGTEKDKPSKAVILRCIKIIAPASEAEITSFLDNGGFIVPSTIWLSSQLDYLRKKDYLIRHKEGSYVLTEDALSKVPHSRNRSSSDIERVLALGRKMW